ncbi:MAG: hypothetical protein DBX55_01920 [Verrucomicrobia bacterium]|nr:MAG: hypothetical protein DBX55_01920 [Verrucomicrobiota bacterium]
MSAFKLTIDGQVVEAEPGMTVLQAAQRAGIFIPSLCDHKELSPYGACRLCVVEIDKVRGTPTSCTTPAAEGMVVRTNTEQLQTQRRRTLELMMSGHPSPCFSCDSRAECEVERKTPTRSGVATRCGTCSNRPLCGLRGIAMGNFEREMDLPISYDLSKIETNDPFIDKNHNLCVLCGRCFRVCQKIHNKPAISIVNRGKRAKVAVEFEKQWSAEECKFCGACIDECPTGCLTDRWGKWFGAPDSEDKETVCPLCKKHCRLKLKIKDGKVVGTKALSLSSDDVLCAVGKFVFAQILNSAGRLTIGRTMSERGEQVPAHGEALVDRLFGLLEENRGKSLIVGTSGSYYETRKALRAMEKVFGAKLVELPLDAGRDLLPADVLADIEAGKYEFIFCVGNYLSAPLLKKAKKIAVADFAKSDVQELADLVFPMAVLAENAGTLAAGDGSRIAAVAAVANAGDRRPLSGYLADVLKKAGLNSDLGDFDFELEALPAGFKSPTIDRAEMPKMYLGHYLSDFAPDLLLLGFPKSPEAERRAAAKAESGFEILEKRVLAPNFHELKVAAPDMAKHAKPGQFAIIMANADSERSPFTLADWNAEEGWVKFVIEELGRSSAEIGALKAGDKLAVVSGPLGTPLDLDRFKAGSSVLLAGGCYGIGAIYPLARELKSRGVRVVCAIEASSAYMLYNREALAGVSDELAVLTRDGSAGKKGGCAGFIRDNGADFDAIIAIGCVFMMGQCAKALPKKEGQIKLCALNPIMVDGTGMCGACRVSVGGQTLFACVDGPFFELDKVDFKELAARRNAYKLIEIEAMPRHIGGRCHS